LFTSKTASDFVRTMLYVFYLLEKRKKKEKKRREKACGALAPHCSNMDPSLYQKVHWRKSHTLRMNTWNVMNSNSRSYIYIKYP